MFIVFAKVIKKMKKEINRELIKPIIRKIVYNSVVSIDEGRQYVNLSHNFQGNLEFRRNFSIFVPLFYSIQLIYHDLFLNLN